MMKHTRKICKSFIKCKSEKEVLLKKNGYPVVQCKVCGHRYIILEDGKSHVNKVYSDDYFFSGGQGYPNYLEEKDILLQCGKRYARLVSKYMKPGKVLDVGCAAGFILKGFQEFGWTCYGLEPNDTMAKYGRDELGLNITTGDLESYDSNEKFDLINLIQVIGHFNDLDKAMYHLACSLKINGLVLIESWDMESNYAKLMGENWHEYSPPSVTSWFSDETLDSLLHYYGFKFVASGKPLKRISFRHGISLLDESTPDFFGKEAAVRILKKSLAGFNIIYPPFDVKWYIYKKNSNINS